MTQKYSKKHQNSVKVVAGAQRLTWPVIEGLAACSARIGAPESLLKSVKKSGSKAFLRGGRIDTGVLIPELFAALEKGTGIPDGWATPQDWQAAEKARKARVEADVAENSVMPTHEARRQNGEAWNFVFAELERLANEVSPALAGLPAVEVYTRLNEFKEQMRKNAKQKFEK